MVDGHPKLIEATPMPSKATTEHAAAGIKKHQRHEQQQACDPHTWRTSDDLLHDVEPEKN